MASVVTLTTLNVTSFAAEVPDKSPPVDDDDDAIMTAVAVATVAVDDVIVLLGVDAITADVAATPVRAPPPP